MSTQHVQESWGYTGTGGNPANQLAAQSRSGSDLYDVVDLLLEKGIVIDAFVRVSLVGIELLTVDARIVIASVDTYLRFAAAANRLDLRQKSASPGIPELVSGQYKAEAFGEQVEEAGDSIGEGAESVGDRVASGARKVRNALTSSGEDEESGGSEDEEAGGDSGESTGREQGRERSAVIRGRRSQGKKGGQEE